jgi:prepilin-type N-terminal cleavage/methylation domain-containing protein
MNRSQRCLSGFGETGRQSRRQASRRGFSLVELLAVIAIITAIGSMLIVSVSGFASGVGRRGAVNVLMNTFEQARIAALESGAAVYVLIWRRSFPDKDAVLVMRDRTESDVPPAGTTGSSPPVCLTGWITLPGGIIFRTLNNTLTTSGVGDLDADDLKWLPQQPISDRLSMIKFNYMGIVESPKAPSKLDIYLSEGVRDSSGVEAAIRKSGPVAYLEKISLARYTGRARLEVTATP